MDKDRVMSVFRAFKVGNNVLPALKYIVVSGNTVRKTDLDRFLVHSRNPFGVKDGVYECLRSVIIPVKESTERVPAPSAGKAQAQIKMPLEVFRREIGRAVMFTSKSSVRQNLAGMLWEVTDRGFFITATDGKRLYQNDVAVSAVHDTKAVVALSDNSWQVLSKIMAAELSAYDVTIEICTKHVWIMIGEFSMQLPIVDVQYPDCNKILKAENTYKMYTISGLEGALKFLGQFAKPDNFGSDNPRTVRMYKGKMQLGAGDYQQFSMAEHPKEVTMRGIDIRPSFVTLSMQHDGSDAVAFFYYDYLVDVVKMFGDRVVMYYHKDSGQAYFCTPSRKWF